MQGGSYREERARAQVLHEMQRRDDEARARGGQVAARYSRQLEQADAVEASYIAAENATRGNMLNRKGRAHDINPRALITGREADFRRYASDELMKYYQTHHRPTAASFRGADTRVAPRSTEPKRRQYGVRGHPSLAAARRRERQAALSGGRPSTTSSRPTRSAARA